jgi:Flp pilus assembly pilin Flp
VFKYIRKAQEFFSDDQGAVLVEYALLVLLIGMVALVGIQTYGRTVAAKLGNSDNSVSNAVGP